MCRPSNEIFRVHHRVRKVSNVPIGEFGKDDDEQFDADVDVRYMDFF